MLSAEITLYVVVCLLLSIFVVACLSVILLMITRNRSSVLNQVADGCVETPEAIVLETVEKGEMKTKAIEFDSRLFWAPMPLQS